MIHLT
jgi:hypothetical protein